MVKQVRVKGMTCAACVRRVEKALLKVEGVESATVNYATGVARLGADPSVGIETVTTALEKAGYGVVPIQEEEPLPKLPIAALVVAATVMIVSMAQHHRPVWVNAVLGLATTWVLFWPGRRVFTAAWGAARHSTFTMDSLIAMGTLAGWGYSVWAFFRWPDVHGQADHIYFEAAAVIMALVLLGRYLEHSARHRMVSSLHALMDLTPPTALVLRDETETEIPYAELMPGDRVVLKPGARVPVDGRVLDGQSNLDESMWTGEPLMVTRRPGDRVLAGSLNGTGRLVVQAEGVGQSTYLASMAEMVADAQGTKAPIQQMVDRVAAVFVPIVIGLALLTFLGWLIIGRVGFEAALIPAVAVLVIACPCALGLATPTAIVAGVGLMARRGILVRDGSVFERATRIKTLLLDKTGTLTEGKFSVRAFIEPTGAALAQPEWMPAVAALEHRSEHPLAAAFADSGLAVEDFESHPGLGISGRVEGRVYRVGKLSWIAPDFTLPEAWRREGWTPVAVERDGEFIGAIALGDQFLEGVQGAFQGAVLVSGDVESAVQAAANWAGARDFRAGVTPHQKVQVVREFQREAPVAMLGDGINDAAALAVADLGLSMGTGTDLAKSAADVTLVRQDPRLAQEFLRLSRSVVRTIQANLFWAFGYNVLMIPLAMSGKMSPMWAAGAMALSSLSVVLNSSRLSRAH